MKRYMPDLLLLSPDDSGKPKDEAAPSTADIIEGSEKMREKIITNDFGRPIPEDNGEDGTSSNEE